MSKHKKSVLLEATQCGLRQGVDARVPTVSKV